MNEILKNISSKKLNRKVDRPALKKVNKEYKYSSETSGETSSDSGNETEYQENKMKRLVKSWSKPTNQTDVAKLFREMISRGGVMPSLEVKKIIKNEGAYSSLTIFHRYWETIFMKDENKHYIKQEAENYYNTLQKE